MKGYVVAIFGSAALVFLAMAVITPDGVRKPVKPSINSGSNAGPVVPTTTSPVVELLSFLPPKPATDGSVDYTARVQQALDAAAGRTLRLAPFPVLVSPVKNAKHCLAANKPVHIVGGPSSALVTDAPRVQVLRIESTSGVLLDGFTVRGAGGVGHDLHHGLVQVWNCEDVEVRGLRIEDADADAIAIANSTAVRVNGCSIRRASKAGIYLTACTDATVVGNTVLDTVGHVAPGGQMVGAGILLLSNVDTVCSANVVDRGVGVGIVCGSNDRQRAPDGVSIIGNRVRSVSNPTNPATSGGIHLANSQPERVTHVLVASNSVAECGQHAILVENHDGAVVQGNTVRASKMSGIVVGHANAVTVVANTLIDVNAEARNGQAGVYLHSTTSGCLVRDNVSITLDGLEWPAAIDRGPSGANRVE